MCPTDGMAIDGIDETSSVGYERADVPRTPYHETGVCLTHAIHRGKWFIRFLRMSS